MNTWHADWLTLSAVLLMSVLTWKLITFDPADFKSPCHCTECKCQKPEAKPLPGWLKNGIHKQEESK